MFAASYKPKGKDHQVAGMSPFLFSVILVVLRTCHCAVTYSDVEAMYMTADHYWNFDQTPVSTIKDLITTRQVALHNGATSSPSPLNNSIFLDGTAAWVDLDTTFSDGSCLYNPSECNGLTVAMLLKIRGNLGSDDGIVVFGHNGNATAAAEESGVSVIYYKRNSVIEVQVVGNQRQCSTWVFWPRNRWTYLVIMWSASQRLFEVFQDKSKIRRNHKRCMDKVLQAKGPKSYYLGKGSYPVAYYDMIGIWSRVVRDNEWKGLLDYIADNGGETVLNISLRLHNKPWNSAYLDINSEVSTRLKRKIIRKIDSANGLNGSANYGSTEVISFQSNDMVSAVVAVNTTVRFEKLDVITALALQDALDDVDFPGGPVNITGCYSDDNFFCETPTGVTVKARSHHQLTVSWSQIPGLADVGYYSHHSFTFNKTMTTIGTSMHKDNPANTSHTISNLTPYTIYCIRMAAESFKASGFSTRDAVCERTHEHVPARAPLILSAFNTSHLSIYIEWNQTIPVMYWNAGNLTGYRVSWNSGWRHFGLHNSSYNITGLLPYRLYTIKVSGTTNKGHGVERIVKVLTAEWYPWSYPWDIKIYNISKTSIMVTWDDVIWELRNGITRKFNIEFYGFDSNYTLLHNLTMPGTNKTYLFTNLAVYNKYGVRMKAFTVIGDGPVSDMKSTYTEESVPVVPPYNVSGYNTSAHTIRLHWNFNLTVRNVLGILRGFRVFYYEAVNIPRNPSHYNAYGEKVNTTEVPDLWPFTLYNLSMAGFTRIGYGVISSSVLVKTEGTIPGHAPDHIVAYHTNSTSLRLHWGQVPDRYKHDIMLGYRVFFAEWYNPSLAVSRTFPIDSGINVTEYHNLKKYTQYSIKVLGYNKHGDGVYEEVTARTDEDVPSRPPSLVTAAYSSSSSILVSWRSMQNDFYAHGIVLGYRLLYNRTDGRGQVHIRAPCASCTSFSITGLEEYVNYQISIQVFNSKGRGPFSQQINCTTDQDVPAAPPQNFSGYNVSKSGIKIIWEQVPAEERNGIILGYHLRYHMIDNAVNQRTVEVSPNLSNYTIRGLEPYTIYNIKIVAFTRKGDGQWSPVLSIKTEEEEPQIPPGNVEGNNGSYTSINVTWQAINPSQVAGILRHYSLIFEAINQFGNTVTSQRLTLPITKLSVELTGLRKYTNYSVTVFGVTKYDGIHSHLIYIMTEEDVPVVAPYDVSGHNISAHVIRLHWKFNSTVRNVLGVLRGFRIFYSDVSTNPINQMQHVAEGEVNTTELTNLWPFTKYNVTVAAFTRMGHGVISTSILVTSDRKVPGHTAAFVTFHNTSSTSLKVSWGEIPQRYHHGVLLGYKVSLWELNGTGVILDRTFPIEHGLKTTEYLNLKKYTLYKVKVLAFNSYGDGSYAIRLTRTDEDVPSRSPTLVTAWNTSSTSISVSWQPLENRFYVHGVLLGYVLSFSRVDGEGSVLKQELCPMCLFKNLTGLDKFVNYSISIQARTSKGEGVPSEPVFCTTDEDVPTLPPSGLTGFNVSKNSITVSWQNVPSHSQNGIILEYHLSYNKTKLSAHPASQRRRRRSANTVADTIVVPPTRNNYTLYGLEPYTLYNIKLMARTRVGYGPGSIIISIRTDDEEPQIPPWNVTGYNTTSTSVNVSWQPIDPNRVAGVLRYYTILYEVVDDERKNRTAQRVTLPITRLSVELEGLRKYANYSIVVFGVTRHSGVPSAPIFIVTDQDTPDLPPQDVAIERTSYSSLNVSWRPIPKAYVNGILNGFLMFYKKTVDVAGNINITVKFKPNETSYHITDLDPSTKYSFWLLGYTSKGYGVVSEEYIGTTDEHVPSKPPANVSVVNFTSPEYIKVSWSPVPNGFVHGNLLGYRIVYQKIRVAGIEIVEQERNATFGPQVLRTDLGPLDNFAVYSLRVMAFTIKGDGVPSETIYGETCRCRSQLRTSWYPVHPYVTINGTSSNLAGITPFILNRVVRSCCGNCINGHGYTNIDFLHDGEGHQAQKFNISRITQNLIIDTDLTFPVNGFKGKIRHGINKYVQLIVSPGVAFIAATETPEDSFITIFKSATNSWKLLLFMCVWIYVAGVTIWALETKDNSSEFPRSFTTGVMEGCWFAFVSFTTVGYGDRTPRNVCARLLTIIYLFCGIVLVSLLTAQITTALVSYTIKASHINVYRTKVGAISNSLEYNVAIRRNAFVNTESEYHSYEELRQAMISGEVKGILVDSFVASHHAELFNLPQGTARVTQMFRYESVYGVVLGGRSAKLQQCFNDYLDLNKAQIYDHIEKALSHPKAPKKTIAEEIASGLFDIKTKEFATMITYTGIALLLSILIGSAYEIMSRRKQSLHNNPISDLNDMKGEMREFVDEFYENFNHTMTEMKRRHREERLKLFRWLKRKLCKPMGMRKIKAICGIG